MATHQAVIPGNVTAPQPTIVLQPAALQFNNENLRSTRKTVKGLAIAEIVLGSACILLSIVILALPSYRHGFTSYSFGIGEGIWCGIWIITAGCVGYSAAKENGFRTKCMINGHMALSIIAAVFSAVMFSLGIVGALINTWSISSIILYSIESVLALTLLILCIISASYCCILLGCCCQTGSAPLSGTQVFYQQQQPQVLGQSVPGYQQAYVIQTQPGVQPTPATTSVLPNSFPTQQYTPNVQIQQPNPAQKPVETMYSPPPYFNHE